MEEFDAVIAHLGNGASVTAIQGGHSVDTSMGFTPLEGLVMGTRSGDLDPSILVFLGRAGWTPEDLDSMLNRESGLKGLAGNNDMRSVVEASEDGDAKAAMALAVTSYRLAKYIGGYHVAVGGAKALVFTAGIGENSHQFRALVADRLGALGIEVDAGLNAARSKEPRVISTPQSAIPVLVVPTDEERAIAEATAAVEVPAGSRPNAGHRAAHPYRAPGPAALRGRRPRRSTPTTRWRRPPGSCPGRPRATQIHGVGGEIRQLRLREGRRLALPGHRSRRGAGPAGGSGAQVASGPRPGGSGLVHGTAGAG